MEKKVKTRLPTRIPRTDKQLSLFLIIMSMISFFLIACTTDSVPDEDFETPTGNFPLLGTVPDRPPFQSSQDITRQQRRLQHEHEEAAAKQGEIIKSIRP